MFPTAAATWAGLQPGDPLLFYLVRRGQDGKKLTVGFCSEIYSSPWIA